MVIVVLSIETIFPDLTWDCVWCETRTWLYFPDLGSSDFRSYDLCFMKNEKLEKKKKNNKQMNNRRTIAHGKHDTFCVEFYL